MTSESPPLDESRSWPDSNIFLPGSGFALALILAATLLNYLDRLLLSVLAAPIKIEFDLDDTHYGLLSGPAFVLSYSLGSIAFGWLADQRSRKAIIVFGLVSWSAMTIVCGLAPSYWTLFWARVAVGIGESALIPAAFSFMSACIPPLRRTSFFGFYNACSMSGIALSFMVGGWIGAEFGWRSAFLIAGGPGLIVGLLFFLRTREPPRMAEQDGPATLPFGQAIRLLFGNRSCRWLLTGAALGTFSSLGLIQWLPLFFLRSHGMSVEQVGLFFGPVVAGGMMVGAILGGVVGGRLARRSMGKPLVVAMLSSLAIPPLYWLVLLTSSLPVALVAAFLGAACSAAMAPTYIAAIQNVCDPRVRGSAMAAMMLINSIYGMALLPFLVGVASDHLTPELGAQALRYALVVAVGTTLLAVPAFGVAKRLIDRGWPRI